MSKELMERVIGCFIGLAVGDALGAPVEFQKPGSFTPITGMEEGGPFQLKKGQWTDDTAMALCIADSLLNKKQFEPIDILNRFVRWYREGYLSSTGDCFDIGERTRVSIEDFEKTGLPYRPEGLISYPSNGSLMRLAPIPMTFHRKPALAIRYSGESSRLTHNHPECVDACRYLGMLIVGALGGEKKEKLLSPLYSCIDRYWEKHPICDQVIEIMQGSYKEKEPPEIVGDNRATHCLEAALWAFHKSENFRDGCLLAVNLGNDSDTTAAVYGQLSGAYYGIGSIPEEWLSDLAMKSVLYDYAQGISLLSEKID